MPDDEAFHTLPSLTLIFTTEDKENADWDRLLGIAGVAIDAIEEVDPQFSILKSFTFYAGQDYMEMGETLKQAQRDRNQLAEQVREFRRLCDPMEKVVMCTAAEIHSFGFSDPSD